MRGVFARVHCTATLQHDRWNHTIHTWLSDWLHSPLRCNGQANTQFWIKLRKGTSGQPARYRNLLDLCEVWFLFHSVFQSVSESSNFRSITLDGGVLITSYADHAWSHRGKRRLQNYEHWTFYCQIGPNPQSSTRSLNSQHPCPRCDGNTITGTLYVCWTDDTTWNLACTSISSILWFLQAILYYVKVIPKDRSDQNVTCSRLL